MKHRDFFRLKDSLLNYGGSEPNVISSRCWVQILARVAVLASLMTVTACASGPRTAGVDPVDPYESMNRKVFAFNDAADRVILAPVARGYRAATPEMVQTGVGNFFSNIGDIGSAVNYGLQGRFLRAGKSSLRFAINTTIGLLGFLDPATPIGLKAPATDFGETLHVWGFKQGPYIVLPLLGPSTTRGSVGSGVDLLLSQQWTPGGNTVRATWVVDSRSRLLDAESLITGDRYIFLRDAYLQRRAAQLGTADPTSPLNPFTESEEMFDWGDPAQ